MSSDTQRETERRERLERIAEMADVLPAHCPDDEVLKVLHGIRDEVRDLIATPSTPVETERPKPVAWRSRDGDGHWTYYDDDCTPEYLDDVELQELFVAPAPRDGEDTAHGVIFVLLRDRHVLVEALSRAGLLAPVEQGKRYVVVWAADGSVGVTGAMALSEASGFYESYREKYGQGAAMLCRIVHDDTSQTAPPEAVEQGEREPDGEDLAGLRAKHVLRAAFQAGADWKSRQIYSVMPVETGSQAFERFVEIRLSPPSEPSEEQSDG